MALSILTLDFFLLNSQGNHPKRTRDATEREECRTLQHYNSSVEDDEKQLAPVALEGGRTSAPYSNASNYSSSPSILVIEEEEDQHANALEQ